LSVAVVDLLLTDSLELYVLPQDEQQFLSPVPLQASMRRSVSVQYPLRGKAPLSLFSMSNTTPFGYPLSNRPQGFSPAQRMIEDMRVRNFAPNTQDSYVRQVGLFDRHFVKSPEQLGPRRDPRMIYLAEEKRCQWAHESSPSAPCGFSTPSLYNAIGASSSFLSQEGPTVAGHPQAAGGSPCTVPRTLRACLRLSFTHQES
jgi:hypothetical protein